MGFPNQCSTAERGLGASGIAHRSIPSAFSGLGGCQAGGECRKLSLLWDRSLLVLIFPRDRESARFWAYDVWSTGIRRLFSIVLSG